MSCSPSTPIILETWVQEMRHCDRCAGEQIFCVAWEFEGGRVGCCLGCGEERIERFTRTTVEAA
jgi:hypothetical protein